MRRRLFLKNVGLLAATPLWKGPSVTGRISLRSFYDYALALWSGSEFQCAEESVRAALETDSQMAETHGCWAAWSRESGN
jgi:hypothetical protein